MDDAPAEVQHLSLRDRAEALGWIGVILAAVGGVIYGGVLLVSWGRSEWSMIRCRRAVIADVARVDARFSAAVEHCTIAKNSAGYCFVNYLDTDGYRKTIPIAVGNGRISLRQVADDIENEKLAKAPFLRALFDAVIATGH